jgi:hypothetical protein
MFFSFFLAFFLKPCYIAGVAIIYFRAFIRPCIIPVNGGIITSLPLSGEGFFGNGRQTRRERLWNSPPSVRTLASSCLSRAGKNMKEILGTKACTPGAIAWPGAHGVREKTSRQSVR